MTLTLFQGERGGGVECYRGNGNRWESEKKRD